MYVIGNAFILLKCAPRSHACARKKKIFFMVCGGLAMLGQSTDYFFVYNAQFLARVLSVPECLHAFTVSTSYRVVSVVEVVTDQRVNFILMWHDGSPGFACGLPIKIIFSPVGTVPVSRRWRHKKSPRSRRIWSFPTTENKKFLEVGHRSRTHYVLPCH